MKYIVLILSMLLAFIGASAQVTVQVQLKAWSTEPTNQDTAAAYIAQLQSQGYQVVAVVGVSSTAGDAAKNTAIANKRADVWAAKYNCNSYTAEAMSNAYGTEQQNRCVLVILDKEPNTNNAQLDSLVQTATSAMVELQPAPVAKLTSYSELPTIHKVCVPCMEEKAMVFAAKQQFQSYKQQWLAIADTVSDRNDSLHKARTALRSAHLLLVEYNLQYKSCVRKNASKRVYKKKGTNVKKRNRRVRLRKTQGVSMSGGVFHTIASRINPYYRCR